MIKRPIQGEKPPMKKFAAVIFFLSLAMALVSSVMSLYINSFVDDPAKVGLIFSFLILISFLSFFFIIPIIEKADKYKLTIKALIFSIIGYILYFLIDNFYLFLACAIFVSFFTTIRISTMGILVRENSDRNKLSKNEGFFYSLSNLSFTIGSLLIIPIMIYFSIRHIFIFASFLIFISLILLLTTKLDHGNTKKRVDKSVFRNFLDFFKDKNRVKSYLLRAGVTFWWSLCYIYLPLLIIKTIPDYWVGIFLSAITLPLILCEYKFGKMAANGYRKLFFLGFLIPGIFAIICFIFFQNIYVVMGAITLASFGLAMLEGNTESYFFDIVKGKQDLRFYSAHNTSLEIGHICGQFIPAIVIIILPFKYIFLVFALGTLALAILSLKIKNIKENKRKN